MASTAVANYRRTEEEGGGNRSFILPRITEFGFHELCSDKIRITQNALKADKKDPSLHYAHGVAYGARPLKGTSEFEVTLTDYGTGWSGTLKLGIAKFKAGQSIQVSRIPRYSPEGTNHCVWSSDKIHNRMQPNQHNAQEKQYGLKNLDELREGDRLGLRLSADGSLMFFVNGECQGLAAENVYENGHEIYPVVDHYANCKATVITRAVIRVDINLQELCMQKISTWLGSSSSKKASILPLPIRLITALKQFHYQ